MDRFLTSLPRRSCAVHRPVLFGLAGLAGGRRVAPLCRPTPFQHERYWAVPRPRQPGTGQPADAGFWAAVEREDADPWPPTCTSTPNR